MDELNIKNLVGFLRENLGDVYGEMVDDVESGLNKAVGRIQYSPWKNESEMVENVLSISQTLAMFPEGVDEYLTGPLAKFGINNLGRTASPAGGDLDKEGLAYLIYATLALGQMQDICETLETRFGVTSPDEGFEYAEQIAHTIRWEYKGDNEAFFSDLDSTPAQFKLGTRLQEIERKNQTRNNILRGWEPPRPF